MAIERRAFLTGIAAVGAASLIPPEAESAQEIASQPKYHYTKPVIDAHFHWYPPEFADLIEKEGAANGVTKIKRNEKGELECVVPGNHPYAPRADFRQDMTDVNLMLKAMDERHVDLCTLTQTNPHILWAPPAFGVKLAQTINNASSALCVKYPKRFNAAVTLPLQDVNASLEELERGRKLPGMKAVNFPENILGKNIDDKSFWPVYERVEALNLPIFLHNLDPISERLICHRLHHDQHHRKSVRGHHCGHRADPGRRNGRVSQAGFLFSPRWRLYRIRHAANGLGHGHRFLLTAWTHQYLQESEAAARQRLSSPLSL